MMDSVVYNSFEFSGNKSPIDVIFVLKRLVRNGPSIAATVDEFKKQN